MDFSEIGGGARSSVSWQAPGLPLEKIPQDNFYTVKLQTAISPEVSPSPAIYVDSVRVSLHTLTSGSQIYYTLDGSTPDQNSSLYTGPILITQDTRINAITYHNGMVPSNVTSANYRIIPPLVSTPSFYPTQGIYGDTTDVTITTRDDSTIIYYTVDGSNPDTNSMVYTAPVEIDSTTRLKAFAVKEGMSPSNVASATYTLLPPAAGAPVFSVGTGHYDSPQTVVITSPTTGAVIHYATGDDVLNDASPVYSSPITISKTTTLKAYAEKDSLRTSDITIATYTIGNQQQKVDTPAFSLPGGHYNGVEQVSIVTKTPGATIYYTTDGSDPNENSSVFAAPIVINDSVTLKAIATKTGMSSSPVISATYVVKASENDTGTIIDKLPAPELSIAPNPATDVVRISWNNMIYTLDGAYLTITDGRGAVMRKINIKGGYTYYILNTSTFANGVYFIRVVSGSSVVYGKLIIGR
jgi:hypothetical protein